MQIITKPVTSSSKLIRELLGQLERLFLGMLLTHEAAEARVLGSPLQGLSNLGRVVLLPVYPGTPELRDFAPGKFGMGEGGLGGNSIDFKNCPKNRTKIALKGFLKRLLECPYYQHKKSQKSPQKDSRKGSLNAHTTSSKNDPKMSVELPP